MKILVIICLFIFAISCSDNKQAFTSIYGGHTRSNDFEDIGEVFSNYYNIINLRFEDEVDSSGFLYPPFLLNENDFVYFSKSNKIHLVIGDKVMSSYNLEDKYLVANPCLDDNENIYLPLNTGEILSLNVKNRRKIEKNWTTNKLDSGLNIISDLIYYKGNIYSSEIENGLFIYDTSGNKVLNYKFNNNLVRNYSINDKGKLLISTTNDDFEIDDTLYCFNKDKLLFTNVLGGRLYTNSVSKNDKFYIPSLFKIQGETLSKIYCITDNGDIVYSIETNITPKLMSVDKNENLYVISSNMGIGLPVSYINKYDKSGKRLWSLTVDLNIPAPLNIAEDVLAFSGEREGASGVFYVDKNSGKLLSTMSIDASPAYNLIPTFSLKGGLYFGASEKNTLITVEQSKLDKLMR